MRKIYKYSVRSGASAAIPAGGTVIHVGLDPSKNSCVWVEVDPGAPKTDTVFVLGTGWDVPDSLTHVGSWVEGPYVWHAYVKRGE